MEREGEKLNLKGRAKEILYARIRAEIERKNFVAAFALSESILYFHKDDSALRQNLEQEAAEKLFGGILAEGKLRRIRYHSSGFPSFFATIGRNSDSLKSV